MATDDSDIYDSDTFSFAAYRWNERGRSLASRYFTAQRVVNVLMAALLLLAGWWAVPLGSIAPGGLACVFAAIVALWLCLRLAVAAASGRRSSRLDPDARHDYVLYAYHRLGINDAKGRARSLLLLAQTDVLRGRCDLARKALGAVDAEQLDGRHIKLYDLMWVVVCAYGDTDADLGSTGATSQPGGSLAYVRLDGSGTQAPEKPDESDEAYEWYLRYTGISAGVRPAAPSGRAAAEESAPRAAHAARRASTTGTTAGKAMADQDFPDDGTVRDWAAGTADESTVRKAVARLATRPKRNPLVPAAYGLMLAHLLFFLGVWLGAEQSNGWYVRIHYGEVAGTLAALFIVVLVPWTLWLVYAQAKRTGRGPHGWRHVLAIVLRIVAVLLGLVISAYLVLGVVLGTDGSERTVATGMEDSSTGRSYDYLAVSRNGYDPGETTDRYYRASDPILMESWPTAQLYDTSSAGAAQGDADASGEVAADGSDQSAQEGDTASADGAQDGSSEATDGESDTSADDGAGGGSDPSKRLTEGVISNSQGYSQAVQNQMQAVYLYLVGQGTLQDMSLSFGADAKGNAYAVVSSGTEERDGATVQVEHRLYDNGEAVWEGSIKEEIVLEKVYLNSGYDTELEGFYLIDPVSLDVIDEHRTSW